MKENFKVEFLEEVIEFLDEIDEKARSKILFNIDKAKIITDNRLFKKLNEDIWEFRTLYNKIQYRLFAFWHITDEKATIVIATHGIIKKTKKIPKQEIDKATEIKKLYFELKNQQI